MGRGDRFGGVLTVSRVSWGSRVTCLFFFFSSRRRHTRCSRDWSSDVCSSDLVFCEKPLSYSVAEGRAMADGSLHYKRVTQMGNHIHNTGDNYRRVVELMQSGKLGKIAREIGRASCRERV